MIETKEQAANAVKAIESGQLSSEQVEKVTQALHGYNWRQNNIATSPVNTGIMRIDEGEAKVNTRRGWRGARVPNADLENPESLDSRRKRAAQAGTDFQTGLGFKDRLSVALAPNLPEVQGKAIVNALVESGMATDLPPGMSPVRRDPETEEMSFLRQLTEEDVDRGLATPEEVGKYRWTTVDETGLDFGDLADMVDLPELFGTAAAVAGDVLGRRVLGSAGSMAFEFMGDYVGRQLGTIIETTRSGVEVTPEQAEYLKNQNLQNAAINSGIGAGLRAGMAVVETPAGWGMRRARGQTVVRGVGNEEKALAEAQRSADLMQDIENLAGERLNLTAGQITNDARRLQQEAIEERLLSEKSSTAFKAQQVENINTLNRANERLNAPVGTRTPEETAMALRDYNAASAERAAAANAERQGQFEIRTSTAPAPYEGAGDTFVKNFPANQGDPDTGFAAGVRYLDGDRRQILTSNVEKKYRGTGRALYRDIIDEGWARGKATVSDSSVTSDAAFTWSKLADEGYDIAIDPDAMNQLAQVAKKRGVLPPKNIEEIGAFMKAHDVEMLVGEDYVFRVQGVPALDEARRLEAVRSLPGEYNPDVIGRTLDDVYEQNAYVGRDLALREEEFLAQAGWDATTQTSGYVVNNSVASNQFGNTWRQMHRATQQALTPGTATPAQKAMAQVFKEYEEEGFSASLRDGSLDLVQAYRAHDDLMRIYRETGSEEVKAFADALDSTLGRAKITSRDGTPVTTEWKRTLRDQRKKVRDLQETFATNTGFLNGNALFQKAPDGKYAAQSLQTLDKVTRAGAGDKLYGSLVEATQHSPDLMNEFKQGLWALYREKTGINAGKFDMAQHRKFMSERSDAMQHLFGMEDFMQMSRNPKLFRQYANASKDRLDALKKNFDSVKAKDEKIPQFNDSNSVYSYLQKMDTKTFAHSRAILKKEGLWEGTLDAAKQKVQRVTEDAITSGDIKKLSRFIEDNTAMMTRLFGEQYVSDVRTIRDGIELATREAPSRGTRDTQPAVLRVLRSFIGPLSKPQRILTAGSWNADRILAEGFMKITSDPEKARRMVMARRLDPRGLTGFRQLFRLGMMDDMGITEDTEEATYQNWRNYLEESGVPMDPNQKVELF